MFMILVVPKPELSLQPGSGLVFHQHLLPNALGAGRPQRQNPGPWRNSTQTLSCRLGDPPGAAFSEPSPLKHGQEGKLGRGTLCLWLLPSPESCCRDGQEGAGLRVLSSTPRTQWNVGAAGNGVWSPTGSWLNRVFIFSIPCLFRDASTHIPSAGKVAATHQKAHLWEAKWAWIELTPSHPPKPCARWQTITAYASLDI